MNSGIKNRSQSMLTSSTGERNFQIMDLREMGHNYLSAVLTRAGELAEEKGIKVIQNFEPLSLVKFLSDKGWHYSTKKINNNEYHTYFMRFTNRKTK